jgi:hypothetical protein
LVKFHCLLNITKSYIIEQLVIKSIIKNLVHFAH